MLAENALYKINLPAFEGPLDLLLHLIRKNDLPIADIPIASILDQYMEYLALLQELNIDLAGEFILMAAELSYIKSRLLLPDPHANEEGEEDPREELARRLLEYQRFKDAAKDLNARPVLGRDVFLKPVVLDPSLKTHAPLKADSFELLRAFEGVLKRLRPEVAHAITTEKLSVTERIYEVLELLKAAKTLCFEDLFVNTTTKAQCIVTFLAILEMLRLKLARAWQSDADSPLRLEFVEAEPEKNSSIPVNSEFDSKLDGNPLQTNS